jgi:hypothetical protein
MAETILISELCSLTSFNTPDMLFLQNYYFKNPTLIIYFGLFSISDLKRQSRLFIIAKPNLNPTRLKKPLSYPGLEQSQL